MISMSSHNLNLENFLSVFSSLSLMYSCTWLPCSGGWTVAGTQLDLHDPRLLAMAAAERHLLEADYDEYADSSASGAAVCRSAALIVSNCYSSMLLKSFC